MQLNDIENLHYLAGKYPNSALSAGVDLNDSLDIADEQIDVLFDTLAAYDRPVFLHLIRYGAEEAPDIYVSAWKKFEERLQMNGSQSVALVWESDSCEEPSIADWYPGDEVVDWIGMSYCDGKSIETKIQFAREHLKPVMVTAESNSGDWSGWFVPFFQFVGDNNDVVRAVIYTNGEKSRIDTNADVLKQWKDETKGSFWLRASPSLFETLGFTK